MASTDLSKLMIQDLPKLSDQRRMKYRVSYHDVLSLFHLINLEIFNNRLPVPEIQVVSNCRKYWGICIAKSFMPDKNESDCIIRLSDKWYCNQWMITTLAHEMCHQYQWDILSKKRIKEGKKPLMSHGPSFFIHKTKLRRYGIPLKKELGMGEWFKYQNLFKC